MYTAKRFNTYLLSIIIFTKSLLRSSINLTGEMISYFKLSILLAAAIEFIPIESLRILGLFPHPGASHFNFFHPIMRGLADAGHDVSVLSHFPDQHAPTNYQDLSLTGLNLLTNTIDLANFGRPSFFNLMGFFRMYKSGSESCENALNSTALKNIFKTTQRYDVILMEQFNNDCMIGVAWKLQAPVIGLSSCALMPWHYERIGNPLIPSFTPALFIGSSDKMTYLERLNNWFAVNGLKLLYRLFTEKNNDFLVRKYLKDDSMPYIGDLVKETNLMFVNSHYSFSGPRPNSPAVIELGGIHIKEPKPLDDELQQFLDSATDGVIYVSWGSMIRAETLPVEKRNSLLKAFSAFKQKVLWKWENTTLPNQPKNVVIRKWMPQREILCHPNVRVFVSHGGLMGSSEGAYCGVPMVLTPMYGDQFLNSAAAHDRGMGTIVHYEDISSNTMKEAISKALDPVSQENAKKVSFSYKNRPQKPLELAVWWVEHVAATQGTPLTKSHASYLPAYIYHSLDVYAIIAATLFFISALLMYVFRKCYAKLTLVKTKVQ